MFRFIGKRTNFDWFGLSTFLTSLELELESSIGNFDQINQNQRFDWLFVLFPTTFSWKENTAK